MTPGQVIGVRPGKSVVKLDAGDVVVARNALNVRTPPKSRVLVVSTSRGWAVVGRERA